VGTSTSYGGPGTGLVPSWVDDPVPGAAPAPNVPAAPASPGQPSNPNPAPPANPGVAPPALPTPPRPETRGAGRFGSSQANFSRFAGTGSRSYLEKALSSYVRSGNGGPRRAARRMGASRASGSRLLTVIRNVQQSGAVAALRSLNLESLAGQPAADVFLAMMDFVCPPGGSLDEAIAREAMADAICDLSEEGLGNFDTLTPEQLNEFFLDFIARSIEGRVINDIGARGITLPADARAAENVASQLHDFVSGTTKGELLDQLDGLTSLNDSRVSALVNDIYEAAFELVAVASEAAE